MPDIFETRTWSLLDKAEEKLIPVVVIAKDSYDVFISPDATRADLEAVIAEMVLKIARLEGR